MNELKVFENQDFGQIRTVVRDGEPWFLVADVCERFGVTNRNRVLQTLDEDEKGGTQMNTPGGIQTVAIVNEAGLYSLLFALQPTKARGVTDEYIEKRCAELKAFKRWITHEVIPSIRKHGGYMTNDLVEKVISDPDTFIRLAQELKSEREERAKLQAKVESDAPKVRFAEGVEGSSDNILIGTLAKLMKQNGVDIGEKRLFQKLREDGYLCGMGERKNIPTQKAMEMKLFEVTERTFSAPDGSVFIRPTTKVTGKGQVYFLNRYKGGATA